jgi:hypothetical protein
MSTLQAICRRRCTSSPPAVDSRRTGEQTGVKVSSWGSTNHSRRCRDPGLGIARLSRPHLFYHITKLTETALTYSDDANIIGGYNKSQPRTSVPKEYKEPQSSMSRTMLAQRAMLLFRRQPSSLATSHPLHSLARRPYSTQQQPPPSATGDFYKTFTRPVAKCLLFALFTYQLTYWAWLKLEQDEIKMERTGRLCPRPTPC